MVELWQNEMVDHPSLYLQGQTSYIDYMWVFILQMKWTYLASPAMQEIRKLNNIKYLEKWEIFSILLIYQLFGYN